MECMKNCRKTRFDYDGNIKTRKEKIYMSFYDELRLRSNTGWNTWFSSSMTAHVLLPYGFCIGLGFK